MNARFKPPKKRAKAPWTRAFPAQAKALSPERSLAGGVKARSASHETRMAVYRPIAEMFKRLNPYCQLCTKRGYSGGLSRQTTDIHHSRGRDGLLLFDTRWFKAACRQCHDWAENNPEAAAAVGATDLAHWRKNT